LVHLDKSEIPDDYVAMAIELDRALVHSLGENAAREMEALSSGPGASAAPFQREFYAWPVLRVPSVIVPREHNYVLLPDAPNFSAGVRWMEPFRFDPRLFEA